MSPGHKELDAALVGTLHCVLCVVTACPDNCDDCYEVGSTMVCTQCHSTYGMDSEGDCTSQHTNSLAV